MLVCPPSRLQRAAIGIAAVFGVLSILAGGTILLGLRDAGYEVVRPVLVFNTIMGVVYLAAAAVTLRDLELGWRLAFAISLANAAVLTGVALYDAATGGVATETVAAMLARTLVWFGIFGMLSWVRRPRRRWTPTGA